MIEYSFGEKQCRLDWNDFLCITKNVPNSNIILYKSNFKNFAEFYEYIDKNKKSISHILFDGYEYFLENGVLHNLYGPAITRYLEKSDYIVAGTQSYSFYIDGKLVCDNKSNNNKGCRKIDDFQEKEIFFYKELTNKKSGIDPYTNKYYIRTKNVDYIIVPINLKNRILLDQRKKKLKQLSI
jgi:hypothetical protein